MNDIIQEFLKRKVSRKEFLSYFGAAVLVITGINGILKSLKSHTPHHRSSIGYGKGAYGG